MLNLELLQTFLKIVEYQQISLAAEALFITQSAVSTRLNKLESQLGVKLINRKKGHSLVTLTKYGESLVPIAQQLSDLTQKTHHLKEIANYHFLKVIAPQDIMQTLLPDVCSSLLMADPLLRYTFATADNDLVYDAINNQTADLGFAFDSLARTEVTVKKIGEAALQVLVSADSWYSDPVHIEDLARHDEIYIPYSQSYNSWHLMYWDHSLSPYLQLDSGYLAATYLSSSKHWALIPQFVAQKILQQQHRLKSLTLVETIPPLPIMAIQSQKYAGLSADIDKLLFTIRAKL